MKIRTVRLSAITLAAGLLMSGCGVKAPVQAGGKPGTTVQTEAQSENDNMLASDKETIRPMDVADASMSPVYGMELKDGVYAVKVDSSSGMFKVAECRLTVQDGVMSAVMTMGGTGYLKLYMGTGAEAVRAGEESYIPFAETEEGAHTFEIPVEALDLGIDCTAFSKNKEKWYDRVLLFRSDSLPLSAFADGKISTAESLGLEDGAYTVEVALEGGSGRASVESPAKLRVEGGKAFASVTWSSANYDYMKVDGETFDRISTEGNSAFEIPVLGFDWRMPVLANTVAMSGPHEIQYTLVFDSSTLKKSGPQAVKWSGLEPERSMALLYADQFSVDYYPEGLKRITVKDGGCYLVVPEGGTVPADLPGDMTVIRQPLQNIYLAATSAMDLFRSLDGMDRITLSGIDASGWYIEEARQAMEEGHMFYAGKYSAPDYERILSKTCDLAIESTMIYHSPEVKEQLENLGIPVFVERSSYESHPLGRMEWLKLYGALLDREDLAETCFMDHRKSLETVMGQKPTGKTAAFFFVSSNGYVNVRKSGDYVAKMIEMAGGSYVPQDLAENENALSTMNMQMEAFYSAAKDTDFIIYNSTVDGELKSLDELLGKSCLFGKFRAVREGNVWCTGKNLFQETMGLGGMILDINRILTEENPDPETMNYLYRLE